MLVQAPALIPTLTRTPALTLSKQSRMAEPSPECVEALFQQAVELAPERRGAFLDERCAGDPDLRAAVEEFGKRERTRGALPESLAG